MFKEIKQGQRDILLDGICQVSCSLIHDEINGAVTKHRHPHEGKTCGNKQHARNKLTNCPATGYARDEHTDKWRPGKPPSPIQ